MVRRLKILVSAYACSPVRGSEPGIGWGFIKALAEHHDLWVITEKEIFQDEIEGALQEDPLLASRVQFYFIHENSTRNLHKIWPPFSSRDHRTWHRDAFQYATSMKLMHSYSNLVILIHWQEI